jgi:membrane-bound ClpP family serine protease
MASQENNTEFAFTKQNYIILAVGFAILIIGFLLMMGGESTDPNVFTGDQLFNTRRIVIAPVTVLFGFFVVGFAIMKKSKSQE